MIERRIVTLSYHYPLLKICQMNKMTVSPMHMEKNFSIISLYSINNDTDNDGDIMQRQRLMM